MFALLIISIICLFAAFIVWIFSEGEYNTMPIILWIIATVGFMVIISQEVNFDKKTINADVPEEYWNGDIKHLEVYRRTPDSIYLRFKAEAYNKSSGEDEAERDIKLKHLMDSLKNQ